MVYSGAGSGQDSVVPRGARSRHDTVVPELISRCPSRQGSVVPRGARSRQDNVVHRGAYSRQDSVVASGAGSRQDSVVPRGARSRQDSVVSKLASRGPIFSLNDVSAQCSCLTSKGRCVPHRRVGTPVIVCSRFCQFFLRKPTLEDT